MTDANQVLLMLLVSVALYALLDHYRDKLRCGYCGTVSGHTDHCPYQGTGTRG